MSYGLLLIALLAQTAPFPAGEPFSDPLLPMSDPGTVRSAPLRDAEAALAPQPGGETSQGEAPVKPPEEVHTGVDGIAVPLVSFNTDVGFGFGAAGGVYFYGDKKPYAHALSAQVFFTTKGVQSHFINYDAPGLIGPLRFEAHIEYARDLYAPYYGPGNISSPGAPPDPGKRFSYLLTQPMVWTRLRYRGKSSPFEPYFEYRYRSVSVQVYPSSILVERPPAGIEGGAIGVFTLGALWDTRDSEADTTRGELLEAALRGATHFTGSDFAFGGFTVSGRKYLSLFTPMVVLAGRVMVDGTFGDTPFFVWPYFGGISNAEGIGGQSSVRGVPRDRYQGDLKAFGNLELRISPFRFHLFGGDMKLGAVGFIDSGRIWHAGVDDGGIGEWHSGAGAGLRLTRAEAVVRMDYGVDLQTQRKALYLAFGQLF